MRSLQILSCHLDQAHGLFGAKFLCGSVNLQNKWPLAKYKGGQAWVQILIPKVKLKEIVCGPLGSRSGFHSLFLGSETCSCPGSCFGPHAGTRSCQSSHVSPHRPSDTAGALHLLPNPPTTCSFSYQKPQLRTRSLAFPRLYRSWTGLWCGSVDLSASCRASFLVGHLTTALSWCWSGVTGHLHLQSVLGSACTGVCTDRTTTYALSGFHDSSWMLLTSFATQWSF